MYACILFYFTPYWKEKVMTVKRLERASGELETVGCGSDYMSKLTQLCIRGMDLVE